jgi:hypothetical protein
VTLNDKNKNMLYVSASPVLDQGNPDSNYTLSYDDLTAVAITRFGPVTVVCHLISGSLDASMVLRRLVEIGYRGQCIVLAPRLPRREIVQRELQADATGISVELIEIDQN